MGAFNHHGLGLQALPEDARGCCLADHAAPRSTPEAAPGDADFRNPIFAALQYTIPMVKHTLTEWFESPLGAYVTAREQAYFDEVVADIFGFNAMQFGLPVYDFLRTSRMPFKFSARSSPVNGTGGRWLL